MEEQLFDPDDGENPSEGTSLVGAAIQGMVALRRTVERKLDELNAMTEDELKAADLVVLHRELGRAATQVVIEEGKVTHALRQQTGGDGIDLDAARAAIRSRLDSIRCAGDPGGFPGEPGGE